MFKEEEQQNMLCILRKNRDKKPHMKFVVLFVSITQLSAAFLEHGGKLKKVIENALCCNILWAITDALHLNVV